MDLISAGNSKHMHVEGFTISCGFLSLAIDKEECSCFSWGGWMLPPLHPEIREDSSTTDQSDKEDDKSSAVEFRMRGSL